MVTGGTGFVGRFICEFFAKKGNEVTATYRRTIPQDNNNIKYVKQELSNEINIEGKFDAIVHTACSHSGKILPMQDYIRDNIDSARALVGFARNNQINTIIYFSTRSIYGTVYDSEVNEDTNIVNPDRYGMTKYIAEQIFMDATDINTIGLRTPGIIGPGAHDIWLVDVVEKALRNEEIDISDFYTKNLVWLEDIAKFINLLIIQSLNGDKYKYPVINLACKESVNNIDILNKIKERLNSKSEIIVNKPNPNLFVLNATKAFEMGFEPSLPLDIVGYYLDYICNY